MRRLLSSSLYVVRGDSMSPALHDGDRVLVWRRAYREHGPRRGDIVLLRDPVDGTTLYVKRIVGLPGEWVRMTGGRVLVNDKPLDEPYVVARETSDTVTWPLEAGQYFVLGDKREDSRDSRRLGPVAAEGIIGGVWLRFSFLHISGLGRGR